MFLQRAANKKSNQNLNNASATPASENAGEGEAAAPATPITPVNPGFNKGQQGGSGPQATGTAAPAVPAPAPVPPPGADLMQNGLMDSGFGNMVSDTSKVGVPFRRHVLTESRVESMPWASQTPSLPQMS